MPREYYLPPPEDISLNGPSKIRIFNEKEIPDIGSLEKEAFSYIGNWNLMMDKQGYGLGYRLGTKENIKDDEGDSATLVFHFAYPIAKKGLSINNEIIKQTYDKLHQVMKSFTMLAHQSSGENIISINPPPPKWMMKELEEML